MKMTVLKLVVVLALGINSHNLLAMEVSGIVSAVSPATMTLNIDDQRVLVTAKTQFIPEEGTDIVGYDGLGMELQGKRVFYEVEEGAHGQLILLRLMVSSEDEQ